MPRRSHASTVASLDAEVASFDADRSVMSLPPSLASRLSGCPSISTLRQGRDLDNSNGAAWSWDFDAFAEEVRRELAPSTVLERVLADRVVLAAWRLHLISRDDLDGLALDAPSFEELPPIGREVLRAESSLETALTMLRNARADRGSRWGDAAPTDSKAAYSDELAASDPNRDYPDLSNEWPELSGSEADPDDFEDFEDESTDDPALHQLWRGRLVFDEEVSTTSPVVKGTWITAGHVVSLVVDGWTWSDILRTHPELTEDDLRACLAYSIEHDER